jgi:endonuclease-3
MNPSDFPVMWKTLKKQVAALDVPWIDDMAGRKRGPYEILVACILSLRTKDDVTAASSKRLFRLARTPRGMVKLEEQAIADAIYPAGFYRTKAKTIRELSQRLLDGFGGRVPDTMDSLLSLKGVGRKTANLVLASGFGKPAICVDTHVNRIPNRWGLIKTKNPHETEAALMEIIPQRSWKEINPTLVPFGQFVCTPVSPRCSQCSIGRYCKKVGVSKSR